LLAVAAVAALPVTPTYLAKFDVAAQIGLKGLCAAIIGDFNQTCGAPVGRSSGMQTRSR
jgi:branched-chain amino acid transport system permease protein